MEGNKGKKNLFILLLLLLVISLLSCGEENRVEGQIEETSTYLMETVVSPSTGTVGGEWLVLGVIRGNQPFSEEDKITYYDDVASEMKTSKGKLDDNYYSQYARVAMGVYTVGKDPTQVEGYSLFTPLENYEKVVSQGTMGPVFALIASNYCGVTLEEEERYLAYVLEEVKKVDYEEKVDYMAMFLQALSYYREEPQVEESMESLLIRLGQLQKKDGGYESLEATAQVIIGVTACGIDIKKDGRFIKEGKTLEDGLFLFQKGKGFIHEKGDEEGIMATEQGLLALDALMLQEKGKSLYEKY